MDIIVSEFKKGFRYQQYSKDRGIGIECEIPVVTKQGDAVSHEVIQNMFLYLEKKGFVLEKDSFSGLITAGSKRSKNSLSSSAYTSDTVTTDVGYSIVELVLAPQDNLHTIQVSLSELLLILILYFDSQSCLLLGYGIQPITPPSAKLLMPKERYCFFKKFSETNHIVPKSQGMDSDLLTVTASNQCHIEIEQEEAVRASNVLNMLSGLQIILHANSPIWKGRIDAGCKTNREMFWDHSFIDRLDQVGIPPQFDTIESYVHYLLKFRTLLVKREGRFLKIRDTKTFGDFFFDKKTVIGTTLQGTEVAIMPEITDMQYLIPFSWFNARLVPKYGTIESRMCCQQPPEETLTTVALTLGLIENLEAAEKLANRFTITTWQKLREEAVKKAFGACIGGKTVIHLLIELLDIARKGLEKRGLNEELFLDPLDERVKQQVSPADKAIEIFRNGGMELFLASYAFRKEHMEKIVQTTFVNEFKTDMI